MPDRTDELYMRFFRQSQAYARNYINCKWPHYGTTDYHFKLAAQEQANKNLNQAWKDYQNAVDCKYPAPA